MRATSRCFASICFALLLVAGPAALADVWDNTDTGIWTSDFNWDDSTTPTAGDEAIIDNGGTAQVVFLGAVAETLHVNDGALEIFSNGTLTTAGIVGPMGEPDDDFIGFGGDGTVTVSGPLANWTSANNLLLGTPADGVTPTSGTLNIEMGGTVQSASATIGFLSDLGTGVLPPTTGTVSVSGNDSTWNVTGAINVGWSDLGTLTITDGGTVTSSDMGIGLADLGVGLGEGKGMVTVSGPTSTLTVTGELALLEDNSSLTVSDGGTVDVSGTLRPGVSIPPFLTSGGALNIGNGGAPGFVKAASIEGGSTGVVNFNHTAADYYFTGNGTTAGEAAPITGETKVVHSGPGNTTLSGLNNYTGGTFFNNGTVRIASDDNLGGAFVSANIPAGRLNFDGGTLQTTANVTIQGPNVLGAGGGTIDVVAGTEAIFEGLFENRITGVNGQGEPTTDQGHLTKAGDGTLILSGGEPKVSSALLLDESLPYSGGTTVEAGTLRAGAADALPDNTAYTVNGGTLDLNGFDLTASSLSGSGGTVELSGADLTVEQDDDTNYAGAITGADNPSNSLTKRGTGILTLSGNSTYDGGTVVHEGALEVTGSISHAPADVVVGDASGENGALGVRDDGAVSADFTNIANQAGSVGLLLVEGADASWTSSSDLRVGRGGDGTLGISGGASVSNRTGVIGDNPGSEGLAVVQSGSTWSNSGFFFVGVAGEGRLDVLTGSTVEVEGSFTLASQTGSQGTLFIGRGGAPGIVDTTAIHGGAGDATLNFNHNDPDYSFTHDGTAGGAPVALTGSTNVNLFGTGRTTLLSSNTYTGPTTIDNGTLLVEGSIVNSVTTVNAGGTLGGSGELGDVIVNGGTLAPGSSAGALNTGALSLDADSVLEFELDALAQSSLSDIIFVRGDLVLDGTLNLTNLGGMAAGQYVLFNYTGTLVDNGLELGLVPGQFDYAFDLSASGLITLNVVPEPSALSLLSLALYGAVPVVARCPTPLSRRGSLVRWSPDRRRLR